MRAFEHNYFLDQPLSHTLLAVVRTLGEYKGRQDLYREQSPQVLETLEKSAMVESVESSNRIEGVTMAPERLEPLVAKKIEPQDRSEAEIAGYRDVLAEIHTNAQRLKLSPNLDRIVEQSKESYWDVLFKSSQGWHEGKHDLRPWWDYFLGTLIAAHKEFEERVGAVSSARGAKRDMVQDAVARLPDRFKFSELQRACPGVSYATLRRALMDLRRAKKVRCLGKGRDAQWERIGSRSS